MTIRISSRPAQTGSGGTQRGFSLWELAILLGLLSLLLAAGFSLLQAKQPSQIEAGRSMQLAAAERALTNFLALNARLPCPDSTGAGIEDCTAGVQKGWLPTVTLGLDASGPVRGVARLRYVVYRAGGNDLAAGLDRFNPAHWDGYRLPPVAHVTPCTVPGSDTDPCFGPYSASPQVGMPDACQGLNDAAKAASSAALAHIPGTGGAVINVAYAIADGGTDRDGDGNVFDGALNPSSTPELDSPSRPASADYDDRVIARGFSDLAATLNCQPTTRSLDAIAQAVEISNEVHSQAESAKLMAIIMSSVNGVKAAIQRAKLYYSGVALATAITTLSIATAALSAAIASCAVLVGCAFIPTAAAAVTSASIGVGFAASAVALNAAAVALHVTATVKTAIVAQKAAAAVDPSSVNLADLLAQVRQAKEDAAAKAAASNAAAAAARNDVNAALAAYNQEVMNLRDEVHSLVQARSILDSSYKPDPGDVLLNALITNYKLYADANAAFVVADGQYKRDDKKYNDVLKSYETARDDAINNPADSDKQDIYQKTLGPDGQKRLSDLLLLKEQSATNLQAKLNAKNDAERVFNDALAAANAAYGFVFDYPVLLFLPPSLMRPMIDAYDGYLSKIIIAAEKDKVSDSDAQNAADSVKALDALNAAIAAQQANPNASAITLFPGGENILKEADLRGGLK